MHAFTLEVPKASPSLNEINGRHWRHYREQKKLWEKEIWVAKSQAGIYGMPMFKRAKVSIERYGLNLLDVDNLTGGCKMIIDALRALGLIEDDSPAHIDLTVKQHCSKSPRTLISVQEV